MLRVFRRLTATDSLVVLIILIGALLRFYRLPDIPFTHDEFSAIIRTRFSTFSELLEYGIKIDGHPAGIQVFLYYLVRIFGVSEAVLKIPFILFGLFSVWLVYLIGKDWFNSTTGLAAAAFMSFLQFPVMYSQIARPYASGLFFSLLMVFFWTKVIFHPNRRFMANLAGYILAGALCTYNHHFSLLFAFIVGLTGLFFCPPGKMKQYLIAGGIIILLYLPHLPIFLHQLSIGGIKGWLSKPRYDFIFDFIQYLFQFSPYIYLLILALISLSLYWYSATPPVKRKFILISVLWFILPYLVGFFYSRYRNSVLQYSVLIFSFPYLLFLLFGFFKTTRPIHQGIVVTLIAIIVIPSLVIGRKHFSVFYRNPYQEMVAESKQVVDSLGAGRCLVILDAKKEINPYYLQKFDCNNLNFNYFEDIWKEGSFISILDSSKMDYLAFGCLASTKQEIYPLILERFPYLLRHKLYNGGEFYLFSKKKPATVTTEYFDVSVNGFEPSLPAWGWVDDKLCSDSLPITGSRSFVNTKGDEFSPTYTRSLRDMMQSENDIVDVSVDLRLPMVFPGAWLVTTVTSGDRMIKWLSVPVNDYIRPGQTGRVYQSVRLSDVELRHHRLIFTTYVWNPVRSAYVMDNFTVKIRTGNPLIYGLYRKIGDY